MKAAILVIVAVCFNTATDCAAEPADQPSKQVTSFLTQEAVDILAGATKVEVFRIDWKETSNKEEDEMKLDKWIGHYKVTAVGKEQGKEFAAKLRKVLFDDMTYDFISSKICEFSPGVAFRVWKDKAFVEVMLSFSCDELLVRTRLPSGKWRPSSIEDFDANRATLVRIAKEAFPDDKVVQGLAEKRKP